MYCQWESDIYFLSICDLYFLEFLIGGCSSLSGKYYWRTTFITISVDFDFSVVYKSKKSADFKSEINFF